MRNSVSSAKAAKARNTAGAEQIFRTSFASQETRQPRLCQQHKEGRQGRGNLWQDSELGHADKATGHVGCFRQNHDAKKPWERYRQDLRPVHHISGNDSDLQTVREAEGAQEGSDGRSSVRAAPPEEVQTEHAAKRNEARRSIEWRQARGFWERSPACLVESAVQRPNIGRPVCVTEPPSKREQAGCKLGKLSGGCYRAQGKTKDGCDADSKSKETEKAELPRP